MTYAGIDGKSVMVEERMNIRAKHDAVLDRVHRSAVGGHHRDQR